MISAPPVLHELLAVLRRRGAPRREVEYFRQHLATLPDGLPLPCPLCFVNGRKGLLEPSPHTDDDGLLRCSSCGERMSPSRR